MCMFYSRPVVWNRNMWKDKDASNLWSVLQRKPLRKWPRRRSRIAEDKIQICLRKIAFEIRRIVRESS